MSLSGVRSNRGDAYQRSIALYWVIKMLLDDGIIGLQVDAVSLPEENYLIYGDDIVILFNDDKKRFIQAKVNQTNHQYWKLTDAALKEELNAAKEQLLADISCNFFFYSRTPFGDLQRLIEEAGLHVDYQAFSIVAPQKQKDTLKQLSQIWNYSQEESFPLVKRLGIGEHHSVEEWETHSFSLLKSYFSEPKTALELIYNFVDKQHSKLGDPIFIINRKNIFDMLEEHSIYHVLSFNEQAIIQAFRTFSLQGRQWVRTIGDDVIVRKELEILKHAIENRTPSVLLEDVAGGGKTCILLDLMDWLDEKDDIAPLFIKGDIFASIESLMDLTDYGLPNDFVAQCAYLAGQRQVVVIIDSLDVLAVGRSHKSLQCFLGLIASLSNIPNITVIAASRSFDAQYDPLLRETSWSETVTVPPLSFTEDITPLLVKWGVTIDDINTNLQRLLLVPQNLRLVYVLIQKGMTLSDIEEHDLYDLYIREMVENDQHLGIDVVDALQNIAMDLLTQRSYKFPRNKLNVNESQLQRLLSQEVITEVDTAQLMFSHQTLADALRIRLAQLNNVDLKSFVTSQPQLPFIRPAIRAFILSLRKIQPDQFTKQLHQFLLDESISMHLKRLAVETLAEMNAKEGDLITINLLSSTSPILFNRFLDRANREDWFLLMHDHWLNTVNISSIENGISNILRYFLKFLDGHEELLIAIWNRAIDEKWLPREQLTWSISLDIRNLKKWDAPGTYQLIEKLFDTNDGERDDTGIAICKYIEATDQGDELLWRFIIRDAISISEIRRGRELKLNCENHKLLSDNFLEERLKSSDILFSSAIEYLLQFSQDFSPEDDRYPYESHLLDCTSYNRRHTQHDTVAHDSIHEFLDTVEVAMKFRAESNDPCWNKYEPDLRLSRELGVRYLLCETYLINIPDYIEGIAYLLTDKALLRFSHLEYELGTLSMNAYPHLSHDVQKNHQLSVMGIYEDINNEDDYDWIERKKYEYLIWIPTIYRLPELNNFIDKCEKRYGNYLPEPDIRSWGGSVSSPIPKEKIIELSNNSLIRLLHHYNDYNGWADRISGGLSGGRDTFEGEIRTVASHVPIHFASFTTLIANSDLSFSYVDSIISGITTHIKCRFGNLSDSSWQAVEPLLDGETIGNILLDLVDRYFNCDIRGYTLANAIEACSFVLNDDQSITRLCFHLWRLGLSDNPEPEKDDEAESLIGRGINSVRGIAAESLLIICNERIEKGLAINDELHELLKRYAKDPSMVVRASFLRRFPYFHSKEQELGWELVGLVSKGAKSRILKYLEQTLYYQYHSNFEEVNPYLDLLKSVNHEKNAVAWGRLASLSFLSDHISEEKLWHDTEQLDKSAKKGMGQVFVKNLNNTKSTKTCISNLTRLIELGAPKSIFMEFEHSLENKDYLRFVPLSLIQLFVEKAPAEHIREIDGTFYWLEKNVTTIPNDILLILEKIIERLSNIESHLYFHRPEALISTLKLLLQEADLSDDNEFINRVLSVQDWFLDNGLKDLETLIEAN